jgi:hypothetical protein
MLWQRARVIQAISQKHYLLPIAEPGKSTDVALLKRICNEFIESAKKLMATIRDVLGTLAS